MVFHDEAQIGGIEGNTSSGESLFLSDEPSAGIFKNELDVCGSATSAEERQLRDKRGHGR